MFRDVQYHAAKHLDEATVGVGGKARIAAAFGQGFDTLVVEPRFRWCPSAGHGKLMRPSARSPRGLSPAEILTLQLLGASARHHLAFDFRRDAVGAHVFPQAFGLDGEAGGTGSRHWSSRPGQRLCRLNRLSFCVAVSCRRQRE